MTKFSNKESILVKAKRKTNNEWITGYIVPVCDKMYVLSEKDMIDNNSLVINRENEVDENTICRFTGKFTITGEPVWEYDKVVYHFNKDVVGIVRFGCYENVIPNVMRIGEYHCGFYVEWPTRPELRKDLGYWFGTDGMETAVAGNLYD